MTQTDTKTYIITGPGIARQEVEADSDRDAVRLWAARENITRARVNVFLAGSRRGSVYAVSPGPFGHRVTYLDAVQV